MKPKPKVLLRAGPYRLVYDGYLTHLEQSDGRDKMNVERWRSIPDEKVNPGMLRYVTCQIGYALVARAKRKARARRAK